MMTRDLHTIKECLTRFVVWLIYINVLNSTFIPVLMTILDNEHNI